MKAETIALYLGVRGGIGFMVREQFYLELLDAKNYNETGHYIENVDRIVEKYWEDVEYIRTDDGKAFKLTDPDDGSQYLFEVTFTRFTERYLDDTERDQSLEELVRR